MDSKSRFLDQPAIHVTDQRDQATDNVRIDPAASAALAEAVASAKRGLKPAAAAPSRPADRAVRRTSLSGWAAQAAFAFVVVGAGSLVSYTGTLANREAIHRLETETARSQDILARLSGDLSSLKDTLAAYRDVEQTSSIASASDQAQLSEQVERLAIAVQEPGKTFAALEARIGRMETEIMAGLTGLAAKTAAPTPAAPAAAGPQEAPAVKPARTEPLSGWVLREVYDGAALVEGQNRRLYEISPGGVLPGGGRIEAIERRDRGWVVVTDRGFIGTAGTYR